ncbi:MAG: hypothetical protein UT67_C0018G0005 [Candidatus Magasanikbacteria bacterium GW2011_GWA2_40_10]|uniref:Uncharacterized protein n=1 Tax=Candidatus Magasanikbacteria bacterium GW2011_GWA2_40_10 TaxID=1619037 RepID=A0A0G0Q2D7_9BACT|nr:MAG: hypothetical protein UT67_C0018G0005 [Candidatus Magasanikbacteria bacterium GW2011_GWA2_40_10]
MESTGAPSFARRRVLATVKCQVIGVHATLLIGRQNDMSRWKYRRGAQARQFWAPPFVCTKGGKMIIFN